MMYEDVWKYSREPVSRDWRLTPALTGLAAGWLSLCAWSAMVAEPGRYLLATLLIGMLVVTVGIVLRAFRVSPYVVGGTQLILALLGLDTYAAARESLLGVVPTPGSLRETVFVIVNGAASLNQYASPVSANPRSTAAMLAACGVAVILSIDVLAFGVRRPPLAALPLLVALSVPVSILTDSLALPIFVGTALLFLRLVASDHLDRLGSYPGAPRRPSGAMLTTFWTVAVAAVVIALLTSPLVPVSDLLKRNQGGGGGDGAGGGYQLTTVNPFIRLRRDLVEQTHTPLLYAETKADSTSYLRTTVLDQFTSDEWRPSPRNLPSENSADGTFPDIPGLAAGVSGTTDTWKIHLDPNFATSWLPLPYPVLELNVESGWRFDSRTLDVAFVGGGSSSPLNYTVKAFTPQVTASMLRSPVQAPAGIRVPMTLLPRDFPAVITRRAQEVTKGADTNFDKAVALQDWFRSGGGFTYSLDQRGGSGMDLLEHFVTDDRVGYCEQFAAAMAAMGRSLGIPSRVVVGFLDGEQLTDGRILYSSDERHAWPEMYFAGVGWVRFEPTPGSRSGASPSYTRVGLDSASPGAAPTVRPSRAAAAKTDQSVQDATRASRSISVPWRWGAGVLLLVLVLLGPALLRRLQRRRRLGSEDPVHLAEGAWAELRATAVDLGLDWPEQRTPREQARRVSAQVGEDPDRERSLQGLLAQVERGRYAPSGGLDVLTPEARTSTLETVSAWRQAMRGSGRRGWRAWGARVWPRSLVRRPRD